MLLGLGLVCIVSVHSELGGVWGAFFVRGVSGGNSGESYWGELVGDWGNCWKEVDPETAVCRARKVTARQGETAAPCGCRSGGLETAAPCGCPGGKSREVSADTGTNEHCLPDAGLIDVPFPFPVRAAETAGRSLGKSLIW